MPIVVGIDGTGPFFDTDYHKGKKFSFVSKILMGGGEDKKYFRGPIGPGGGLGDAINGGLDFIMARRKSGNQDILLTGYSRGGLGVLVIAEKLRSRKIPVKAMMLFDAVDRHAFYDADSIPNNVEEVFHVRRHKNAGSRESFGNCGTRYTHPTKYTEKFYLCTHGGVGGGPWVKPPGKQNHDKIDEGFPDGLTKVSFVDEQIVSMQVWSDIIPFLSKHKF